MKRHLIVAGAFLLLTSCTPVDDFGEYWNKGFVDPALAGAWKKIGLPGENIDHIPGADKLVFEKNGDAYAMGMINPIDAAMNAEQVEQQKKDNADRWQARTLRIGRSVFMMAPGPKGTGDGMLQRYEVKGRQLNIYYMQNEAALDFLRAKHPDAKNIVKNTGEGSYVVIHTFDDEVFRILGEIADNPAYWFLECRYSRGT